MEVLDTPYQKNDLIWAKLQNYPWWPGKIAEIFEQKGSIFFKISFYADPTYCYIKEEAIIPFDQFRSQLNANFSINSQLQKAINLANNAFQRKKQALPNPKLLKQKETIVSSQAQDLEPQIFEEDHSKGEDFEQSTIHIDFEAENSNGKVNKQKKATQLKTILQKYKLDKIPQMCKQQKVDIQEEPSNVVQPSQIESDYQDKVELFDLKNTHKRKSIKKSNKRKPVIKKRRMCSFTDEQRRIQFMKRLCSTLISKGFDSQISRQITVKLIEKTEHLTKKLTNSLPQRMALEEICVNILKIVTRVSSQSTYDDKLMEIFSSTDALLYQYNGQEKQEEEKTNTIYIHEESLEALC